MKHNKRSGVPGIYVAIDVETDTVKSQVRPGADVCRFRLGCGTRWRIRDGVIAGREDRTFDDPHALWAWVADGLDAKRRTLLCAHNLGFDLTASGFWHQLSSGMFRPVDRSRQKIPSHEADGEPRAQHGLIVLDDPCTILDLENVAGAKLVMVDTMNYYHMALAQLGESLGLPKLPMPGDESGREYVEEYCRRDVEIVVQAVTRYVQMVQADDLGNLRFTASSQSMALFRHRCMTMPLSIGHPESARKFERQAYYGARCRAYFTGAVTTPDLEPFYGSQGDGKGGPLLGTGPVYRLDVNAQYPSVMTGHDYPVSYIQTFYSCTPADLSRALLTYEAVAEVELWATARSYPQRTKEGLRWGRGLFTTTLCGPELRAALAAGAVEQVFGYALYLRGRPFDRFVSEARSMRAKYEAAGDRLGSSTAKILANALHGKFAQRSPKWVLRPDKGHYLEWGHWHDYDITSGVLKEYRQLGGWTQELTSMEEAEDNFPLVSAYVAGYAREMMCQAMAVAGERNVLYEDADTMHVTQLGYDRLSAAGYIHQTEMGKFRAEECVLRATYRGPKNYCLDGAWTRAGVGRRDTVTDDGTCEGVRIESLGQCIDGPPPEGPLIQSVRYTLPVPKIDGRINPDGWIDWPTL